MVKEINYRLIASLQIVTAAGLILFWIAFFTVGMAPDKPPACYFAYEHAFPLPDGLLAVLLMITGILLMKNSPVAGKLSLAAAGALMFLGLLDFSFNIQNGIYTASTLDLVINAFINLWCTGFGLVTSVLMIRKKDA
jgi:hypothetical protein